jgi:hypothetical protein
METRRIERRHTSRPAWDGLIGLSACLVLSHAAVFGVVMLLLQALQP